MKSSLPAPLLNFVVRRGETMVVTRLRMIVGILLIAISAIGLTFAVGNLDRQRGYSGTDKGDILNFRG
jgi:hypothetical protein